MDGPVRFLMRLTWVPEAEIRAGLAKIAGVGA